jgi:hypothetical protein
MSGPPPGPGAGRAMSVGNGPPSAGLPPHNGMPPQQNAVPPPPAGSTGPQSQQNLNQIVSTTLSLTFRRAGLGSEWVVDSRRRVNDAPARSLYACLRKPSPALCPSLAQLLLRRLQLFLPSPYTYPIIQTCLSRPLVGTTPPACACQTWGQAQHIQHFPLPLRLPMDLRLHFKFPQLLHI